MKAYIKSPGAFNAYLNENLVTVEVESLCVGPLDVNCYIVGCPQHQSCAIVDPGDSGKMIMDAVASRGWTVTRILNTHGHVDHTGANRMLKQITGAPLAIHRLDGPMLTHPSMKDMAAYLGLALSPEADILLDDGEDVAICPCQSLKVIHTPGHSPGGACFYHEGFLIAGDTIFRMSVGRSDLPGGDHDTLIKSIRQRIFTLPDETIIYPGHGDPTTVEFEKGNNPFVMSAFFR